MISTCGICAREIVPWQGASVDDPAMDCGGDCLACVVEAEGGIPSRVASPGIMFRTTHPMVLTPEQAEFIEDVVARRQPLPEPPYAVDS